jgi:lipoprotein-anchoring transpeptidase ErfK/SrfK
MRLFLIIFALLLPNLAFATVTKEIVSFEDLPQGTVVISTSERKLYLSLGEGKAYRYGIAVGTEDNQWVGETVVTRKVENPTWFPTNDQRAKNGRLPRVMPPGPSNPLGVRAIYLGWSALRIHGTIAPHSIGRAASGGCYRMHNADVIDLYKQVHIGASIIVRE